MKNRLTQFAAFSRILLQRLVRRYLRWWHRVSQPGTGGLIQPGDWRVIYRDGERSRYMSHGDAENYAECFGGRVEWRYDASA